MIDQAPERSERLAGVRRAPLCSVVGGGLAGCEAAWQLAERGVPVRLFEMRPLVMSPAHATDRLAEVVCSNSLPCLGWDIALLDEHDNYTLNRLHCILQDYL